MMAMPVWPPGAQGQIWEECSCGREPIYLPHLLCERCWPKTSGESRLPGEQFDKNDEPKD